MTLSSTDQNPCGTPEGNPDRDRRPCKGTSQAGATRPVASAQAAPRQKSGRGRASSAGLQRIGFCLPRLQDEGKMMNEDAFLRGGQQLLHHGTSFRANTRSPKRRVQLIIGGISYS
jgi:hypothetical protein